MSQQNLNSSYTSIDALPRPPTSLMFSATPGVNIPLPRNATPIQYFQLFLTSSVLQYIIDTTNHYATAALSAITPSPRSLFRTWKDVTMQEVRAFIGVILQMGLVQLSDIKDYWSTHTTLNFPFFHSIFSRDRFLQIFRMLHVRDKSSTTRWSKIQPFLDCIIPLFQQCLTPRCQPSIDEAMIAFRGRILFRQYIHGKPEPWGIKAYVLSESATGYMYNLIIYYGQETQLVVTDHNHTANVVLGLISPLVDHGYDLYTDGFYTSPLLASEAEGHSDWDCYGQQKRHASCSKGKETAKGRCGHIHKRRDGSDVVVKRTITTLSTKHANLMVSVPSRLVVVLV